MWKGTPHNTAHMRQHEKIEKFEAWDHDFPVFQCENHENEDFRKIDIYMYSFSLNMSFWINFDANYIIVNA